MLFVSFLFALGTQIEHGFWWNMGFKNAGCCDFYNLKVKDPFSNVVFGRPLIVSISISDSRGHIVH